MEQARILRVVVASPGDVQKERDLLPRVIDELNRGIAGHCGFRLDLYRWETHAYPGMHAEGPQGLIDPILGIDDCDVLIGTFWTRFGTPTKDGKTGTEHEFHLAYEAWQQHGRPQVMVYFNQKAYSPKSKEETDQWGEVLEFKKNFPKEGFWWPYSGVAQFEQLVRNHLTLFLRGLTGKNSASAATVPAVTPPSTAVPLNALHSLPPPPGDFTGRTAELDELRAAIEQGGVHISGLQGQGGVGKTALALKLAEELTPKFPDAQIYLDLQGVSERPWTPAEAMAFVIRAFDLEAKLPEGEAELRALYLSRLNGKRVLLLMDNARDAAQVAPLVPPQFCVLLVTSRLQFTLPGLREKRLDVLPPEKAEALLLEICSRIDGQAGAVATLCGRLPLALRLAAAALKEKVNLAPEDYVRRLKQGKLAALPAAGADPSMEACIGLSYDLLSPAVQKGWRKLGVFPDTFDAPAAVALWQMEADGAEDMLGGLLKYSMLEWNGTARRYRLHDLMRDFARTRLQEVSKEHEAARRHATYYVNVLGRANGLYRKGRDSIRPGLALFDLEWGNIQAGQAWAAAHAERDNDSAQLCNLYPDLGAHCLDLRLHPRERIRWREAALAAACHLSDRRAEGMHLSGLGTAYGDLGEHRRAIGYFEGALVADREVNNRRGESQDLGNLGNVHARLGEYRGAIRYLEQALLLHRQVGDRLGEGQDLGNLGLAYLNLGEHRQAIERQAQALAIYRETGDRRNEARALGNRGLAHYSLGEYRQALECHEQDLVIAHEIGDRRGEGYALWNMSLVMDKLGERQEAIEHAEAAIKILEQIESPDAATVRKLLDEWKGSGDRVIGRLND